MVGVTLPDATAVAYGYDADGRRVSQSIDGQVTDYLWDEASAYGDVVLETGGSDSTLASYYLQDGQGSTRALANDSGALRLHRLFRIADRALQPAGEIL